MTEKINVGIVGICGRGSHFKAVCDAIPGIRIHAVCDLNAEGLAEAAKNCGASEQYLHFDDMLESSELDAVIVGTPMHLHVSQSIAALARGLHVLSEVTAGVSIEECRDLVQAAAKSSAIYMLAENYLYMEPNTIVREIACGCVNYVRMQPSGWI